MEFQEHRGGVLLGREDGAKQPKQKKRPEKRQEDTSTHRVSEAANSHYLILDFHI